MYKSGTSPLRDYREEDMGGEGQETSPDDITGLGRYVSRSVSCPQARDVVAASPLAAKAVQTRQTPA